MPKRKVNFIPNHYYHLYNRGARRISIFQEDDNYLLVIKKLKEYSQAFNLTIIAYCLMPNHYHFLVRQNDVHKAGLLPQRIFNSYSKIYNKRYKNTGTLFQGPYKPIHITKLSHLLHLCRYIHANPIKDGFAQSLNDWRYSNYLEWVNLREGTLVDHKFVRFHFPTPQDYIRFVEEYLDSLD